MMDLFNKSFAQEIRKLKDKGVSNEKIVDFIQNVDLSKQFGEIIEIKSKNDVDYFENTMYERVLEERARAAQFIAHHEQIWGKGFVASEAMYILAVESAQLYGEYLDNQPEKRLKDKEYRFLALREIHSRACQQFLEIIYLMKAGFADGAYARWRSMYELSVIAEFISHNDEPVAKAFVEASSTEARWNDWAKAAPCFAQKKRVTFNDIQEQCDFSTDDWRKQYQLANKVVHASPQGTFGRLGNYVETGVLSAGHSDYGISTAAEHSAISLSIITTLYLTLIPYGDGLVHADSIRRWVDIVRKYYSVADKNCFSESNTPKVTLIDGTVKKKGEIKN